MAALWRPSPEASNTPPAPGSPILQVLVIALKNAGRAAEVQNIYEREARITGSYDRLVKYLVEHEQFDVAERWAIEGIGAKLRPPLISLERESEWRGLVESLRERYRNRPKFIEVLDELDARPIAARRAKRR